MNKLQNTIAEIKQTEKSYLKSLVILSNNYYDPLSKLLSKNELRSIFSNLKDIIAVSRELSQRLDQNDCVSKTFVEIAPFLKMYSVPRKLFNSRYIQKTFIMH